jgi:hypothetical protein
VCADANGTNVCSSCASDLDCTNQACGIANPLTNVLVQYRACLAKGSRALGEICAEDAECATSTCHSRVCSTCAGDNECQVGQTCSQKPSQLQPEWWTMPFVCHGGVTRGEMCLTSDDCNFGEGCNGAGTLFVCGYDGRSCTVDADCPPVSLREPGTCLGVGTIGGICTN